MKAIIVFLTVGLCLGMVSASADSIKVGAVLHKDVYIVTKQQYYLVHFPDEGRVEKISRARRDVEAPIIDTDRAAREALRARFDARRGELEGELEAAKSTVVELDAEAYLQKEALAEGAIFETQFLHWRGLSDSQQQGILREILNLSANKAAKWEGEQSTVASRLVELDATKAQRAEALKKAESKRDSAVAWEKIYTNPEPYLRRHQREVVEYNAGISDHVDDYWLKRAQTEAELEARRVAAVERAHAGEVGAKAAALDAAERALREEERDAVLVENKGKDAARRYGAYLDRIDGLILASQAGYQPGLKFNVLETWQADGDKKTPTVVIESSLWRLHCERADFGLEGDFAITVYDGETDTPFTRIADKDFLKMRSRIFERPGKYYFVVEQDANRIPYELTVSTLVAE